jgi:uncharacterized membrane protein (GlpM family)
MPVGTLFFIQLATSIIVGGGFIAVQSILAERVPQKIAGIVLSIPSTVAVALFFIGLTTSPEAVAKAIPVIPIAFGCGLIFCTVYIYIANNLNFSRLTTMCISTLGATLVWLILAAPLARFEPSETVPLYVFIFSFG